MSIFRLPVEIISMVAEFLYPEYLFNLGCTCRDLHRLVFSNPIGRIALRQAKFAPEAIEAQSSHAYARAFRRLAKRRLAVRCGEPYLTGLVAFSEEFIYTNGVLCYAAKPESVRILDIHGSATTEWLVKSSSCLPDTIQGFCCTKPYQFVPVHYASGILSCLLTQKGTNGLAYWLVILDIQQSRFVACLSLLSTEELFVRNNRDVLFYGTLSLPGPDGKNRWEIRHFDLSQRRAVFPALRLWDFSCATIGSRICFEIFDDYFYCVSSEGRAHPQIGWNSFYLALRFDVKKPTRSGFQYAPPTNVWRRHNDEGPSDMRWASLQLARDQTSGALVLYEIRREFLPTNPQSQRTCYRRELRFDGGMKPEDMPVTPPDIIRSQTYGLQSDQQPLEDNRAWFLAQYTEQRTPQDVHVGDNGSLGTMYPINECFMHTYSPSCGCFVDFVSWPPLPTADTQQVRLRVRSKPDLDQPPAAPTSPVELDSKGAGPRDLDPNVHFWPQGQKHSELDPPENILRDILALREVVSEVDWAMDDRSLVYAPVVRGQLRPIVLVSFDPAIRIRGFKTRRPEDQETAIPMPDLGSSEQPWLSRVPAFYTIVPQTFAGHPYGYDMAEQRFRDKGHLDSVGQ